MQLRRLAFALFVLFTASIRAQNSDVVPYLGIQESIDYRGTDCSSKTGVMPELSKYRLIYAVKEVPAHWFSGATRKVLYVETKGDYVYFAYESEGKAEIITESQELSGVMEISEGETYVDLFRLKAKKSDWANQALLPTTTAVTPAASHPSRQP